MKHRKKTNPAVTVGEINQSRLLRLLKSKTTKLVVIALVVAAIIGTGLHFYKARISPPKIADGRKLTKQEKQLKQAYVAVEQGKGTAGIDQLIQDAKDDNTRNNLLYQKAQLCVASRDYACSLQTYETLFNGSGQKNIEFGMGVMQGAVQVKDMAKANDYDAKLKILIATVSDKNIQAKQQADLSKLEKQLHG